jgi:transcriptional regulator with XRE-family HTH domain
MTAAKGIASRIATTRTARGFSRSEFARLVGVTPTAVWNWEETGTTPRSGVLTTIAKVLGVSEGFLKTGTEAVASSQSPKTIAAIIETARNDIAASTGLPPSRIKVHVEFATS